MSERERGSELVRVFGAIGVVALIGYVVLASHLGVAFAIPVGAVGSLAAVLALRGPLGKALLGQGPPSDAVTEQAVAPLLAEVDDLRNRVQELEERVDFSERLLASQARTPER
jgi:hypothetical protein